MLLLYDGNHAKEDDKERHEGHRLKECMGNLRKLPSFSFRFCPLRSASNLNGDLLSPANASKIAGWARVELSLKDSRRAPRSCQCKW